MMAKYPLLKHYRGAPASVNDVPMDQWTPEEVAEHDRSRWDTGLIAEGVTILQAALARDRLGDYQAQAAIAALHADARSTSEWPPSTLPYGRPVKGPPPESLLRAPVQAGRRGQREAPV